MTSIRRWLLGWLIVGLAGAALVAAYGIFHTARIEAGELFDYELRTVALSLPPDLGDAGLAMPDFEGISDDRLFIQIRDAAGRTVYRSLGGVDLAPLTAGFHTIEYNGYQWRVFGTPRDGRFFELAQPVSVREDLALRLALRTLWPFGLLILAVLALVPFVVARGLGPVRELSGALSTRSLDALEPIGTDGPIPVEIRPLVVALNDLLARLNASSQAQRTFVADAAHELRSPLAALKLQLQAAERDGSLSGSKTTFGRIEERLNRLIHLVHQLLSLAREDAQPAAQPQAVSLRRLCERAVGDFSLLAEAKQIDLGLECWKSGESKSESEGPAAGPDAFVVQAEPHGLEVLLGNLLDNAIRYTPARGRVDVVLARSGETVSVSVSDNGPGIAPGDEERVFDRFRRGAGTHEQGSGLGLAIARKIAERHHATLCLRNHADQPGLSVTLAGLRPAHSPRAS
ncbi:two-component sensor histidine kinase [Burkholderia sp. WAC0059]|uniref:sensor histidine kinase n=1 Tax=Burkholderia sp. WAC0059 TaxID=2066022 RepID=UPI000C7F33C9|nr:ATP-binding protein [Burkholderia sp. WAC0059]PLZ03546.1 two-component sensor histidine kinase [Burkholderia sp. WAC0059]